MPKIKDFLPVANTLVQYFTKNKGLNTVTAAIIPPAVQELTAPDPFIVDVLRAAAEGSIDAALLAATPAGYVAAGVIVVLRVAMALVRKAK